MAPCLKCIRYIEDTIQHPLHPSHPLSVTIVNRHIKNHCEGIASHLYKFYTDYTDHKCMLEDELNTPPGQEEDIYSAILTWYSENPKDLHKVKGSIDELCLWAACIGAVKTKKTSDPIPIFRQWFMYQYLHLMKFLDTIHNDHSIRTTSVLVSPVDEYNGLYD